MTQKKKSHSSHALVGLMVGCIGVVYGDIGTSPLYALRESFNPEIGLPLNHNTILGVLSLLLWSLIMVVSVKYVSFIMRNDNKGEGGILALMALAQRAFKKRTALITSLGLFGAALFYGDGIITPAISVISAVEGLKIATPTFEPYVVPITLAVLVALFSIQSHGTDLISKFFGPVTVVYFGAIGLLGLVKIIENPDILNAINPYYGLMIFVENHWIGFLLLGSVVLAVTGAEALYADMGHFGRKPIQLAWTWYVLPCLALNYLGQGALLLMDPTAIKDPFYLLVPKWALYPMVGLATAATVIASQAMISGVFSVTQQAIQLGFMPRLAILHTSHKHIGQIYLPKLNICLAIGVMILVVVFQSSTKLASAYGIAVTGTMLMTSLLSFFIVRYKWKKPLWQSLLIISPFVLIDGALFSSTLMKLFHGIGAWVPLMVGTGIFTLMMTWKQGRELVRQHLHRKDKLAVFLKDTDFDSLVRVGGTAIYMVRNKDYAPHALVSNLKYTKTMHERVLLVSVQTEDIPRVTEKDRIDIADLGNGIYLVTLNYGFMQQPNVPRALAHLKYDGISEDDLKEAPYYLSRERIVATPGKGMWLWRERLYAVMQKNAADASAFFGLPDSHVVEIGTPVRI
jgi:KUP system potassium uptake protein